MIADDLRSDAVVAGNEWPERLETGTVKGWSERKTQVIELKRETAQKSERSRDFDA